MKPRLGVSDVGWAIVIFAGCSIAGMCFGAFYGYTDSQEVIAKRDSLRASCLAGNDRACKLYEVDYGR